MLYGDIASEAWLHLEPNYYKWVFSGCGERASFKLYHLEIVPSITMPGNYEHKETLVLEYEDERNNVLFPIWRGLKEFASRESRYKEALANLDHHVEHMKCLN